MTNAIEGACRCRNIRYLARLRHLPPAYACHCRDCQTWSGSAFSLQCVIAEDCFDLTGRPALFELTSPNGERISRQYACPICFTRVYNTNTSRPGMVVLRAGTLNRSDQLNIIAHIWTKRKLAGIIIPESVPTWPKGASPAFLAASLKGSSND